MGQHSQSCFSHSDVSIMKSRVELLALFLNCIGESVEQISNGNDDIILDDRVYFIPPQNIHQLLNVLLAVWATDTHELAIA